MPSLATFTEDWSDLAAWAAGTGASVAAGHLQLTYHVSNVGYVHSAGHAWDLTDAGVATYLQPPADATATQLVLHADPANPDGDSVRWTFEDAGGLRAEYSAGGVSWVGAWMPYSPVAHRWLAIRGRDGLVTWDVSADGIEWLTVANWLPTFLVTALTITLRTVYAAGPAPAGPAVFGPLNMLPERPVDPATVIDQDGVPFLAVDVQPDNITGTFTVDVSEVGGPDLLGWSSTAAGSWENVVCDVASVRCVRGASDLAGPLTTVDAGLLAITLSDTERRFDPTVNADAIRPGTPVRIRAWGYDLAGDRWDAVLATATIDTDGLSVAFQPEGPPQVTISASDLVAELVGWRSPGNDPPVGAGDSLLQRATRILQQMGRNPLEHIAQDVDSTGYAASHPAAPLAQPWEELTAAKDAELGRVWVNAANQLVVRTRRSALSGPVRGTLSDVHADADAGTVHCCYRDLGAVLDARQTTNRAIATRRAVATPPDPATFIVEDTASVGRWQPQVAERGALEVETDTQAAAWAEDLVALASAVGLRVDTVAPHPSREDLDNALDAWPAVCRTDLGDRWVVRYHPAVGPVVDRTVGVLGVTHEITPDEWLVTLVTAEATTATPGNPSGRFIVGDSEVGSGDVLVPSGAQLASAGFLGWTD